MQFEFVAALDANFAHFVSLSEQAIFASSCCARTVAGDISKRKRSDKTQAELNISTQQANKPTKARTNAKKRNEKFITKLEKKTEEGKEALKV